MIIKMIKILLITVCFVACNAQGRFPNLPLLTPADPVRPVCIGLSVAPLDIEISFSPEKSSTPELTEDDASKLLGLNAASKVKRAASVEDNGATEARAALSKASGSIIVPITVTIFNPCPSLLTSTSAGQELCPSYQQLLTRFWSSNGNGYCYVLFPQWQRVYQTRCKCTTCRNSCPYDLFKPGSIRFRNYCKPKSRRSRYVWTLCFRNNSFKFIRERVTLNYGGCECRAYKTCF